MCCFDLSVLQRTTKFLQKQDKTSVHFLKLFAQNFCSLSGCCFGIFGFCSRNQVGQSSPGIQLLPFFIFGNTKTQHFIFYHQCFLYVWLLVEKSSRPKSSYLPLHQLPKFSLFFLPTRWCIPFPYFYQQLQTRQCIPFTSYCYFKSWQKCRKFLYL